MATKVYRNLRGIPFSIYVGTGKPYILIDIKNNRLDEEFAEKYPEWFEEVIEEKEEVIEEKEEVIEEKEEEKELILINAKKCDTKTDLEIYAKEFGINLDKRKSKSNMLKEFEETLRS